VSRKKYYALCLDDYATISFVSSFKHYYGNIEDFDNYFKKCKDDETYIKNHSETLTAYDSFKNGNAAIKHDVAYSSQQLMTRITFYGEACIEINKKISWNHYNIYNCIYSMVADKCTNSYIWIKRGSKYLRCMKPSFVNLRCLAAPDEYIKFNNNFWGYPNIITTYKDFKGNLITEANLYVKDCVFNSKEELMNDMENFTGESNYTEFCNDIFGNG
jgi:hypothetical protein